MQTSLEDDHMDNLDNSPHVAIDAMNSISIDSNASLLAEVGAFEANFDDSIPIDSNASLREVGATLLKPIDVTGCYGSSPKLADNNPEEKSVKIHNIKNTLNLPRDPEYDSDEHIQ